MRLGSCAWGVAALALLVGACGDDPTPIGSIDGSGGAAATTTVGTAGAPVPTSYSCEGDDCPACAGGEACAEDLPHLDGSCCALGDAIEHLAKGMAAEAVDIESDGKYALLCGGFGVRINDVSVPEDPQFVDQAAGRCQHASFGRGSDSSRTFYLSHHGDSWVQEPFLGTYRLTPSGVTELASITEPGVLYEGHVHHGDHLYVAAHEDGVRIYDTTGTNDAPVFVTELGGMGNAWKVAAAGDVLYVADNDLGVHVVNIADPTAPAIVATLDTLGPSRDVHVDGGKLFVALGGFGVDVFDLTDPLAPTSAGHIDTLGSAQAVSAQGDLLAVAAWTHVALYDAASLRRLGTEKLGGYPKFEQDLGVAVVGDVIHVAEWGAMHSLRHHPGRIAPDLWIEEKVYQFDGDVPDARSIVVRNHGDLPLVVTEVTTSDEAFAPSFQGLTIAPGQADFFEVGFQPPGPQGKTALLNVVSNDPDETDRSFVAGLVSSDSGLIDVGDTLDDTFAFLHPSGLSGLDGKVVVLAYFALF